MFTILERYLFKQFFSTFLVAIISITAILFIGSAFKVLAQLPGLDTMFLVEVAPFILPYVLIHAMPVAALVAGLTAYCRLAAEHEIMAMKLTGVSFHRLVAPTLFLGLALAFLSLATTNYVSPYCRRQLNYVTRNTVTRLLTKLSQSRRHIEYEDFKFHWHDVRQGKLRDLLVYKVPLARRAPADGPARRGTLATFPGPLVHARAGTFRLDPYFNLIRFELEGLTVLEDLAPADGGARRAAGPSSALEEALGGGGRLRRVEGHGDRFALIVDLESASAAAASRTNIKDRDIDDLMALRARHLTDPRVSPVAIDVEVHGRLSLALSNLSLALLGAALGLLFTGSNRILAYLAGFGAGLIVYYPLTRLGEGAATSGALPAPLAMQIGNLVLWILSFILLRRGAR